LPAGESRAAINSALRHGSRGLPGGGTLRELLQRLRSHMGRRVSARKPDQGKRARVAELRAKGLSLSRIGAELGGEPAGGLFHAAADRGGLKGNAAGPITDRAGRVVKPNSGPGWWVYCCQTAA
jgi:hypothetical protein